MVGIAYKLRPLLAVVAAAGFAAAAEARASGAAGIHAINWSLAPSTPPAPQQQEADRLRLLADAEASQASDSDRLRVRVRGTRLKMRVPLTLH